MGEEASKAGNVSSRSSILDAQILRPLGEENRPRAVLQAAKQR